MAITAKITVDNSELKNGLKQVETQAQTSLGKVKQTAEKNNGDAVSLISKGLSAVSSTVQSMSSGISGLFSQLASGIASIGGPVGVAIVAIGAIIGAAISGVISMSSKLDALAKKAKSLDMTANGYLAIKHAANRAGIDIEKLENIVLKLNEAVIKASDGSATYRDAFYSIGLSWRELKNMSPEERLMAVNEQLQEMKEQGKDIPAELFTIFSRRDMASVNKMIAEKDFNKHIASATMEGFGIDPVMMEKAEALQDMMGDVGDKTFATIANFKLLADSTEMLTTMFDKLSKTITNSNGFVDEKYKKLGWVGVSDVAMNELDKLSKQFNGDNDAILSYLKSKGIDIKTKVGEKYIKNNLKPFVEMGDMSADLFAELRAKKIEELNEYDLKFLRNIGEYVDPRFKGTQGALKKIQTPEEKAKEKEERAKLLKASMVEDTIEDIEKANMSAIQKLKVPLVDIFNDATFDTINESLKEKFGRELTDEEKTRIKESYNKKNKAVLEKQEKDTSQALENNVVSILKQTLLQSGLSEGTIKNAINQGKLNNISERDSLVNLITNPNIKDGGIFENALDFINGLKDAAVDLANVNPEDAKKALEGRLMKSTLTVSNSIDEMDMKLRQLDATLNDDTASLFDLNVEAQALKNGLTKNDLQTPEAQSAMDAIADMLKKQDQVKVATKQVEMKKDEDELKRNNIERQLLYGNLTKKERAKLEDELKIENRKNTLKSWGLDPSSFNLMRYENELDSYEKLENRKNSLKQDTSLRSMLGDIRKIINPEDTLTKSQFIKQKIDEMTNNGLDPLSTKDYRDTSRALGIKYDLMKLQKPTLAEERVYTNELTQKGGFSKGGVVETHDVQKQQINYLKAILEAQRETNELEKTRNKMLEM